MSSIGRNKFTSAKAVFIRNRVPAVFFRNHAKLPAGRVPIKRKAEDDLEEKVFKMRAIEVVIEEESTAAIESKDID